MTKKDLVESIIQNMPDGLTKLEKARYIYIELGKQRKFDTRYYYGNRSSQRKAYKQAQLARQHPNELRNKRTIICTTLSEIYKNALQEVGIDCKIVPCGVIGDEHVVPIVDLHDETRGHIKIRADLQRDLEFIQAGMSTGEFGTVNTYENDYDIIRLDELKRIDKKIGYIQDDYRDKDIYMVRQQIRRMNANDALQAILQDERIYGNMHFNGQVERRKYYRFILQALANDFLDNKIFMFSCYREKHDNDDITKKPKRDYTLCAYSYEKDEANAYLYSKKEEQFLPVTLEKLDKLQNDGLNLGVKRKTKGVNLLKRFIRTNERNKTTDQEEIR